MQFHELSMTKARLVGLGFDAKWWSSAKKYRKDPAKLQTRITQIVNDINSKKQQLNGKLYYMRYG